MQEQLKHKDHMKHVMSGWVMGDLCDLVIGSQHFSNVDMK